MVTGGEPCAAHRLRGDFDFVMEDSGDGVQNTESFGNDLRPDAVAGESGNFQEQWFLVGLSGIRSVEISDSHFCGKVCCVQPEPTWGRPPSAVQRSDAPLAFRTYETMLTGLI